MLVRGVWNGNLSFDSSQESRVLRRVFVFFTSSAKVKRQRLWWDKIRSIIEAVKAYKIKFSARSNGKGNHLSMNLRAANGISKASSPGLA